MREAVVRPVHVNGGGADPWQLVTQPTRQPDVRNAVLDYWAGVAVMRIEGEVDVGIMRVRQRQSTFDTMERHLRTPELIVALDSEILLPVTIDEVSGDRPDVDRLRLVRVERGSGVVMERGVWHAIPFATNATATCLVIFRRNTSIDDLEVVRLQTVVRVAGIDGEPEGRW